MVSRAVAGGLATHNLPNWTRCGYVLYNTHDTVDIVHCTRQTECNIAGHCSASKPNPRAETDNYSREMEELALLNWEHVLSFDPAHNYHNYHNYHLLN